MKRWLVVVLSVVGALALGFVVVVFYVRSTSSWARTLTWEEPNLAAVPDGQYEGTATLKMPPGTAAANAAATVRVTVKDHRYSGIEVLAPQRIAGRMTRLEQAVVGGQTLRPDGISGATVTQSVVLMAASEALKGPSLNVRPPGLPSAAAR